MQYISAKEAGEKWDISQRRVATLCSENRIEGCSRVGNMWIIPAYIEKPIDARSQKKKVELKNAKPFVKWAGGKGQLLEKISSLYPSELGKSITRYVEPFVGGGAVLFDILSKYQLREVYINDINADLINLYKTIKCDVNELIDLLAKFQEYHIALDTDSRKEDYTEKRNRFNKLDLFSRSSKIEKAGLFVFLNKTCFNGLYRVNKKGLFNVPMGAYKNPCICDRENLLNASKSLENIEIICGSYLDTEKFIDKNTFVYIDPPYRPLTQTSSFISYSEFAFNDKEQEELAEFASRIKQKGAKVVLSNSDPKNIDENDNFFENIYSEFVINRVHATRMINSKSDSRGKITELLIAS